jgi:hypothetical protein
MATFDSITDHERRLLELLELLKTAQLQHIVVDDPDAPRLPPWRRFLLNPRRAMRRHFFAQMRHGGKNKPGFRPPLPLGELWTSTRTPRRFRTRQIEENDIHFDDFALSFRSQPYRSTFVWYYFAFPNGRVRFRAIAHESSLRFFITQNPRTDCVAPERNDFNMVRVNSLEFDLKSRPRRRNPCIPTILDVYLPRIDDKWELVVSDSNDFESIIDK